MKIEIETGICHTCRFFCETEDGDRYCTIYNKSWNMEDESDDKWDDAAEVDWCKVVSVEVKER